MSKLAIRPKLCLFLVGAALLGGGQASAHVVLDAPNGGETLYAGSRFTIRWHIQIAHVLQNWDLWYSTTGPTGPWLPIVMDLPPSSLSYEWTTPADFSTHVRVRVRMENVGTNYYDISDNDLTIAPSLSGDPTTISLSSGGAQTMSLTAGSGRAGSLYLLLGSVTGSSPGFGFGGVTIPLNPDGYFLFTFGNPNTPPLSASLGTLDPAGNATAAFSLPPGLPPSLGGITFDHAYVVIVGSELTMASNPVSVTLVP